VSETPLQDWVTPRLTALLEEAVAAGFERQTAVAVIIDVITGPGFNDPEPNAG